MQQARPLSAWAMATPASLAFGSSMLLGSFRVVRLEPVHHLLLVELGAHVEHGAGKRLTISVICSGDNWLRMPMRT